jgi:hypothetical protein
MSDFDDRDREVYEKDEKFEKQEEKDEKDRFKGEEKSVEEKWRRDPLAAAVWALIFIWAGLVLLLNNMGILGSIAIPGVEGSSLESWSIIMLGAGAILLLEVVVRLVIPTYRRAVGGTVFLGIILLCVGFSSIFESGLVWAVALIAAGVVILLRGFLRGRG